MTILFHPCGGIPPPFFPHLTAALISLSLPASLCHASARGSDAVKELYKNVVAVTLEQAWEAGHRADLPGTEVTDVAIIHAVVSPRPKARYLVGQDAKLLSALHSVLPDRVFDAFVQWFIYKDGWRLQYFSWQ